MNAKLDSEGVEIGNGKNVDARVAAVAHDAPEPARQATVTEDEIARRAYELYMSRGREDGGDLDDWLQAERELRTG